MPWAIRDIPDLAGKTFVVTGGNSGIGYEAALQIAAHGGDAILACRDLRKAGAAAESIVEGHPSARVEVMELDLANLASVEKFAVALAGRRRRLDVLCNNAGVMALPKRKTADGFEMHIGTNHLGHFALTGRLLELLLATPGSRVVNVSSTFHKLGKMSFDDLHGDRRYWKWGAYAQSKLANLLFTFELQRRFEAREAASISVACHPGYASTNLQTVGPRMQGSSLGESLWSGINGIFAQSAAMGALPTLRAAIAEDIVGGDYVGPGGLAEMRGHPVKVKATARARDEESAKKLWAISEDLTGVGYRL
jgi:NAD(P)-dependent dehydrogenase (short-subunit alcohol dehydrogenase family)